MKGLKRQRHWQISAYNALLGTSKDVKITQKKIVIVFYASGVELIRFWPVV